MDHAPAGMPSTLVLWDVDHTLIENGGVSKETYLGAFTRLTGKAAAVRPETHGRTDFVIMRELLEANGEPAEQYTSIDQFTDVLIESMQEKAPELPARGHVLPGIIEALTALHDDDAVLQSALTGNIAPNAYAKVTAFGLEKWLDLEVGGFGSDDAVRSKLVDASRRKVAEKYGRTFDRDSTILIGDTPLDVKAGHDGGAKVIAVATGVHPYDELVGCGPDATLHDLGDTATFLSTLAAVRAK
ncbi:HAD family hydrolase [Labedaea rhizosphaerae]|uniref:Phosphoglycolate phosphatase-like HAD superfamily hydrolase n=1 Tax=Labedaea rhizosphaerae TaxID=598644 RepID=A0A4R6S8P2_LABRH|nr:HAD hydrolase-like protein [Labedaea rhizosphaerae]TDP96220.1 phosphoglycolate phosphatase-like HAD superfamily hydrolase [Labedaea rhizosphaerae]